MYIDENCIAVITYCMVMTGFSALALSPSLSLERPPLLCLCPWLTKSPLFTHLSV